MGIGATSVWAGSPRLAIGPRAHALVLVLGLLAGVAGGVYWLSANTAVYDRVPPRQRMHDQGPGQALAAAAGVALPLVDGLPIARRAGRPGSDSVFAAALAMYLVAWGMARRLPGGHRVGGSGGFHALRLLTLRPRYGRTWFGPCLPLGSRIRLRGRPRRGQRRARAVAASDRAARPVPGGDRRGAGGVRERGAYGLGQEIALDGGRLVTIAAVLTLAACLALGPALTLATAATQALPVAAVWLSDLPPRPAPLPPAPWV